MDSLENLLWSKNPLTPSVSEPLPRSVLQGWHTWTFPFSKCSAAISASPSPWDHLLESPPAACVAPWCDWKLCCLGLAQHGRHFVSMWKKIPLPLGEVSGCKAWGAGCELESALAPSAGQLHRAAQRQGARTTPNPLQQSYTWWALSAFSSSLQGF